MYRIPCRFIVDDAQNSACELIVTLSWFPHIVSFPNVLRSIINVALLHLRRDLNQHPHSTVVAAVKGIRRIHVMLERLERTCRFAWSIGHANQVRQSDIAHASHPNKQETRIEVAEMYIGGHLPTHFTRHLSIFRFSLAATFYPQLFLHY